MNPSARLLSRTGSFTAVSALAVGLLAGTLAGSTAAHGVGASTAQSGPTGAVTVRDSRTDMVGHGADIFWVRLVNRDRVKVVVKHRDLVRSWKPESSGTIYLDTDRSTAGADYALVAGLYAGTGYTLYKTDGWKIRYRKPVQGPYRMRLDYGRDLTVLDLARRTLGRPGAVRVSVHTAGNDGDGHTVHDWLGRANSFTPWVRRG